MVVPLLRFIHLSDTHFNSNPLYRTKTISTPSLYGAEALVAAIQQLPFVPDFILHTGDVIYDPDPTAYEGIRTLFSELTSPIYYLAGNHDSSESLQRILLNRDLHKIQQPFYYEFEMNGVQVLCLDSNENKPEDVPRGFIGDEQLAWLDAKCSAADPRPLVIATHHNVVDTGVHWLDSWMHTINGEAVHQIIRKAQHRLRGVFHGHIHQNYEVFRDQVLYSACSSSWAQFHSYIGMERTTHDLDLQPGFSVVTITEHQTNIRRYGFNVNKAT